MVKADDEKFIRLVDYSYIKTCHIVKTILQPCRFIECIDGINLPNLYVQVAFLSDELAPKPALYEHTKQTANGNG